MFINSTKELFINSRKGQNRIKCHVDKRGGPKYHVTCLHIPITKFTFNDRFSDQKIPLTILTELATKILYSLVNFKRLLNWLLK